MKMNKKAALALVAAALAVGVGGAYAGTSGPHRSTPAPPTPRATSQSADRGLAARIASSVAAALTPTDRAAAAPSNSTPTPINLHDLVSAAIAKAVADRHISTSEATLANLFLDGQLKPDPTLRNAWRPIVQAAADALGLSVGSLQVDLEHGESLAKIAGQQGRPPAALAQAIEGSTKAALDRAVADGALNVAARADILELLQTHMNDLLRVHS